MPSTTTTKKRSRSSTPKPNKRAKSSTPKIPCLTSDQIRSRVQSLTAPVMGIDLSVSNPSVAILNPLTKKITLFFYRNRQADLAHAQQPIVDGPFVGWTMETQCWERVDDVTTKGPIPRYDRFRPIVQQIARLVGDNHHGVVGIEHYSLQNPMNSGSHSLMIELGACLRWQIGTLTPIIMEIAPLQVKRLFCGLGKATKDDMYRAFSETYHLPNLYTMLGMKHDYLKTPHPIEDMVDALAVAVGVIVITPPLHHVSNP
jgi:Holliday junction resolvasome RuvABC endonuclease subunit